MQELLGKTYRLVERGGAGLACHEDGVSLGPVPLVLKHGLGNYEVTEDCDLAEALFASYGAVSFEKFIAVKSGLAVVARALEKRNGVLASIAAVQLGLDEFGAEASHRLEKLASFRKYNVDQPRVPKDNPDGGQWTSEDGAQTAQAIPITPVFPPPAGVPDLSQPKNIPWPHIDLHLPQLVGPSNPFPKDPECVEEWANAREFCDDQLKRGRLKVRDENYTGFGTEYERCLMGQISERCGGNPTS